MNAHLDALRKWNELEPRRKELVIYALEKEAALLVPVVANAKNAYLPAMAENVSKNIDALRVAITLLRETVYIINGVELCQRAAEDARRKLAEGK